MKYTILAVLATYASPVFAGPSTTCDNKIVMPQIPSSLRANLPFTFNDNDLKVTAVAPSDAVQLGFKPITVSFDVKNGVMTGSSWVAQFDLDSSTCNVTFLGVVRLVPIAEKK